jgi:hypothetical protein
VEDLARRDIERRSRVVVELRSNWSEDCIDVGEKQRERNGLSRWGKEMFFGWGRGR